ncbi:MAG: DEAD/DEAH box helicase [Permianibacter sp.]
MPAHDWGALLPKTVADWINFDRSNPQWHYKGPDSTSMASRQAEGVAYLWNLLSRHGVALLADEVGMGKTFQALGVAALLWKMKPDAKVLVMAPNRDICAHWRREYHAFVQFHYRPVDHSVKNGVDGGPVQSIQTCSHLDDLATAVEEGAGHLYLTTIHALSGLVPANEKGSDNATTARKYARKIHDRIKAVLGVTGFDLIIVDEAHYFRNRDGGSQRVNAAEAFFGASGARLGDKALLLTATPSHTQLNDVHNILGYFVDGREDSDHSALALMRQYGLRRFRRMQGGDHHYSKREYRCEKDMPCDFGQRPESEMFFALYQKKLVTELGMTRDNKSLLYGFLEGFESIGRAGAAAEPDTVADVEVDEDNGKDFSEARDTKLLKRLTAQYFSTFGRFPDHPKYGQLVEQCLPNDLFAAPRDLHEDKHLVFVRRIPSVRELTQRINEAYDAVLAQQIYRAWGLTDGHPAIEKWRRSRPMWSRSGFDELVRSCQSGSPGLEDELDDEGASGAEEEGDAYLGSAIADLFVVKKGKDGRTDASNVSLRFRKPESAFAMFLEPSLDYTVGGYSTYYQYTQGGKVRADYVTAAREARLRRYDRLAQKLEASHREYEIRTYQKAVKTVWSLVYPELNESQQKKLSDWAENRPDVAENFANYIKTGFLFASPVMVELYAWFTEFNRSTGISGVQERYAEFMNFVALRIKKSLLLTYFKNALDTFEILCEKIVDHKLGEWEKEWRELTLLQNPAWYASGESKNRQRLILGFNSPFYPNVLVATSVFQEGVNLHLQCRKVHHYGLAGSPGANEQRVGRVDRLFGKVNELLKIGGLAELEITYPFLKSSVDEDQVASFIARKFHVEEKMDACIQESFNRSVELTRENWREFLRRPVKSIVVQDPYPARFDNTSLPKTSYVPFESHDSGDIANHIKSLFGSILNPATDKMYVVEKNQHNPNAILLVDPVIEREGQRRRQPVLVEQRFSAGFSALANGTVYSLSLISPIASREDLIGIERLFDDRLPGIGPQLDRQYPLVRMAVNPEAANSHFYLYVRVDLPIFAGKGKLAFFSQAELESAFRQLKRCSDQLEYELFAGQRDLGVSELHIRDFLKESDSGDHAADRAYPVSKGNSRWSHIETATGGVDRIATIANLAKLEKHYFDDGPAEGVLHSALELNHRLPFVSFWPHSKESIQITISYPSGDMQTEERDLLERWFDYVLHVTNK